MEKNSWNSGHILDMQTWVLKIILLGNGPETQLFQKEKRKKGKKQNGGAGRSWEIGGEKLKKGTRRKRKGKKRREGGGEKKNRKGEKTNEKKGRSIMVGPTDLEKWREKN